MFDLATVSKLAGYGMFSDAIDLNQPFLIKDDYEVPQLVNPDFNGEIVWFSKSYKFFTTDYRGYGEAKACFGIPEHIQVINGVFHE